MGELLRNGNPTFFGNLTEVQLSFTGETGYNEIEQCDTEKCSIQFDAILRILDNFGTDINLENGGTECSWNYVNCDVETDIITSLIFFNEDISGTIPKDIGLLDKLEWFDSPDTSLTGTIPLELFNITSLRGFTVPGNNLDGTISKEIGALKNLTNLNLSGNQFSGDIPTTIGDLENLETLDLSGNNFTGTVPAELVQLKSLKRLDLRGNTNLSGDVPFELCQVVELDGSAVTCATEPKSMPPTVSPTDDTLFEFPNDIQVDLGSQNSILDQLQARLSFDSITKFWLNQQNECSQWLFYYENEEHFEQYEGINLLREIEEENMDNIPNRRLSNNRYRGRSKGRCYGKKCPKENIINIGVRR